MPTYKLIYFNVKGLAEPIRFLFHYAGVDFIDERLNFLIYSEEWQKFKTTMPYGQLPVLEIDGKIIPQSTAICRYLGKQFGIAGKNDLEALEIDAIVDTIHDSRLKLIMAIYEKDPQKQAQLLKEWKERMPYYINNFDEQVKKNGGYFVGGSLSWADFVFVSLLEFFNYKYEGDLIENSENLKALREKVLALPGIKAWVAKRPKTDF